MPLYVVATPIGNLQDISARALQTLCDADTVLAEDTRVTLKLLNHFDIHAKLERCDENVISQKSASLIDRIAAGEKIAYVSDAGTPGLSDPGIFLIDQALERGVSVQVIPGPSAAVVALVASGLNMDSFLFAGFAPRKAGQRQRLFTYLGSLPTTFVLYESPYRVSQTIASLAEIFPHRRAALCRELTKLHEEVVRMPLAELSEELLRRTEEAPQTLKGECVIVVEGSCETSLQDAADMFAQGGAVLSTSDGHILDEEISEDAFIRAKLQEGMKKRALAKEVARLYRITSSEAYDHVVQVSQRA